jgi:hypothetical protein
MKNISEEHRKYKSFKNYPDDFIIMSEMRRDGTHLTYLKMSAYFLSLQKISKKFSQCVSNIFCDYGQTP